jgi:tRNA (adenine37-N6)-methyltransferase
VNPAPYSQVTLTPIGVVRSPFGERREAPRQPVLAADTRGTIELFADRNLEQALSDIDSWSHLWVLFWFHLNTGWRPMVRPPRGDCRRGVLATRSPHRPNPVGLSVVKLERRVGLELQVSSLDILDGTPVLDIKPYVAYTDAVPTATGGWPEVGPTREHSVAFDARAEHQLAFLGAVGSDLKHTLLSALVLGPHQPKYRRIRKTSAGFVIAVKEWRALFSVEETQLTVLEIRSGYRPEVLSSQTDPSLDLHRALMQFSAQLTT